MGERASGTEPDGSLVAVRAAVRENNLERARRLLAELTEREPQNVEAWLWRAATAASREEALLALSTALELDPQHEGAQLAIYETLKRQLRDDPFLAYVAESEVAYRVQTARWVRVVVPKRRAVPRPYPNPEPGPLRPAARWFLLALVGLLGTLLFAPLALFSALRLRASALGPTDRKRRRVLVAASLLLWFLGLLLGLLVVIHV